MYAYTITHIHTHTHTYTHIYIHIYMSLPALPLVHIYMCIYIYYMYICDHMYTWHLYVEESRNVSSQEISNDPSEYPSDALMRPAVVDVCQLFHLICHQIEERWLNRTEQLHPAFKDRGNRRKIKNWRKSRRREREGRVRT